MNGPRSTTTGTSDATAPLALDRREAARVLGVSPSTIDNLRTSGQLASVRIGTRRLFTLDDLRAFLAQRREVVK